MKDRDYKENEEIGQSFGTPYDDVFKTLLEKCSKLLIPLVNEVFGTRYDMNENVIIGTNELHYPSIKGNGKRFEYKRVDSHIRIRDKIYHIEAQSNPDSTMEIRMIEYDFLLAVSDIELKNDVSIVKFPKSAVLYLRHNSNTKDVFRICLQLPGGIEAEYEMPVIKVQEYTKEEIFDKNLLFFIPFYIMRFENRLDYINKNEIELNKLKQEYEYIYNVLKELNRKKVIDLYYLKELAALTNFLIKIVARRQENIEKEIGDMGGKVIRTEVDEIWDAGVAKGIEKGIESGLERGRELSMIALIRKKYMKNKSIEVIADETEQNVSYVENVIAILRQDENLTDEEVLNALVNASVH